MAGILHAVTQMQTRRVMNHDLLAGRKTQKQSKIQTTKIQN